MRNHTIPISLKTFFIYELCFNVALNYSIRLLQGRLFERQADMLGSPLQRVKIFTITSAPWTGETLYLKFWKLIHCRPIVGSRLKNCLMSSTMINWEFYIRYLSLQSDHRPNVLSPCYALQVWQCSRNSGCDEWSLRIVHGFWRCVAYVHAAQSATRATYDTCLKSHALFDLIKGLWSFELPNTQCEYRKHIRWCF